MSASGLDCSESFCVHVGISLLFVRTHAVLSIHLFFFLPRQPNFGMSRQNLQDLQSFVRHPEHEQLCLVRLCPIYMQKIHKIVVIMRHFSVVHTNLKLL